MKNLIIVCIVAAFATSCKKDYQCVCTTVDTTGGTTETTIDTFKAKSSKKDADDWCKGISKATVNAGTTSEPIYDSTTSCAVK